MSTKARVLLLCSTIFFVDLSFSQPITWIRGARMAGLANAGVALTDPWNTAGNPAGIASIGRPHLSFALERRFLMKELDTRAAAAVLPVGKQVFGLNINFFGSELYNEHQISLAYARALSKKFRAGFRVNYHGIKIPGYTSQQAWSVTAGIQFLLLPRLTLGAAISNPNKAVFNEYVYAEIPVIASMGGAYAFSKKVMGTVALEHISGFPIILRTGFEYQLHGSLALRAGISTSPFRQYGGLGIRYKGLSLHLAAASHLQLGFTPQIGLSYEF